MHESSFFDRHGSTHFRWYMEIGGSGGLEGVEHVAGKQGENGHNQDRLQLLVVRLGAVKVIARRLFRVILNRQPLAWSVRRDVLGPVMTEFPVIHLSTCLIGELDLVVPRDASQVVVESHPLTGVNGSVGSGPGTGGVSFENKLAMVVLFRLGIFQPSGLAER